jgi:hypothetical protein
LLPARFGCLLKAALATVFGQSSHSYRIIVRPRAPFALKCLTFGAVRRVIEVVTRFLISRACAASSSA